MSEFSCKTCRYWAGNDGMRYGLCRRYAPSPARARALLGDPEDTPKSHWPETTANDWCGEHAHVVSPPVKRDKNGLLTVADAAGRLGVSVSYLNKLRLTGGGPTFLKMGASVRYELASLMDWASVRARSSTSEV